MNSIGFHFAMKTKQEKWDKKLRLTLDYPMKCNSSLCQKVGLLQESEEVRGQVPKIRGYLCKGQMAYIGRVANADKIIHWVIYSKVFFSPASFDHLVKAGSSLVLTLLYFVLASVFLFFIYVSTKVIYLHNPKEK